MDDDNRRALRDLLAKQAIADNLARHSRGVDRADLALLQGAYVQGAHHPAATVAYGLFEGTAADFTTFLVGMQDTLPATLHRTSNMFVRMQGEDAAISESYVIAYLESPGADAHSGGSLQRLVGGRYLDRHRRVGDAWRIEHRTYVLEWNINHPSRELAAMFAGPRGAKREQDAGKAQLDAWLARRPQAQASGDQGRTSMTTGTQDIAHDLDRALSRQALHELMTAYCRGADRGDAPLLASVFHPDARVVASGKDGTATDFVASTVATLRGMQRSFHALSNEWFSIDGDTAVGECYVIAVLTTPGGDAAQDMLIGGRYIDRFERRAGTWKIAEHVFMQDWNITQPTTARFNDEFYGSLKLRGGFAPEDPIYAFWK